jgi:capsid protein
VGNKPDNLNAFDPFRIEIDTRGVAGFVMPSAYMPGQSYEGVRPSRHKRDRRDLGGTPDSHIDKRTLFELQQISLEMDRNNGLSIRMLDAAVEQILGDCGFVLASEAESDELQEQIETDWWNWLTYVCDPAEEMHGVQRLYSIDRAKHQLGGSFIQWDDLGGDGEGQFSVIEATRCVTPFGLGNTRGDSINGFPLVNGIARDPRNKKAMFYWFSSEEPKTECVMATAGQSYPAGNIIHYYTPTRESQTRALPIATALINTYDNIDDVLLYETLGLKAAAACSLNIETANPADTAAWEQYLAQQNGGYEVGDKIEEWNGGTVTYTRKGEKPSVLQSNRPAQEVQEFIIKLVRMVGLPLAVPYEWLMLDFTGVNLGSLRVLTQVIQRTWKRHQFNHGCLLSKLFRKWINRQIARKRYPDRSDVRQHSWNMPTWASPQPVQDATANKIAIEGGWGSEEDAAAQSGKDIQRVLAQRERYRKAAPQPDPDATKKPGPKIDRNGNPDQSGGKP